VVVMYRALYRAREEFLSEGRIGRGLASQVRPEVLASWRRSQLSGASPDAKTLHFECDDDPVDTPLCAAAGPVMARLAERLSGLCAGVILCDRHSRILRRWVAPDSGIQAQMDRVSSIAGSSGSEQFIGTNGIGTVVEDRRAGIVVGPEHFAQSFSSFTCVGAPIHNPLTRKLEGVITLNSDVESASPLLIPLITGTAQEIEQRLLSQASQRERMLLDTFLTASRSGATVAVVGEDVFIAGPRTLRLLEGIEHTLIWQQLSQAIAARRFADPIPIGTGCGPVALRCSPLMVDGRLAGALFEVGVGTDPSNAGTGVIPVPAMPAPGSSRRLVSVPLPAGRPKTSFRSLSDVGLPVGLSAAWTSAVRSIAVHRSTAVPLVMFGEPGTGKMALLRAMFTPAAGYDCTLDVVDCISAADDRRRWLSKVRGSLGRDVVVLRHLDALDDETAVAISAVLDEVGDLGSAPRVVATAASLESSTTSNMLRRLLDQLAVGRIEVPALRERREDLRGLISQINQRYAPNAPLLFSPGAMLALGRAQWPGNVRQLEAVIRGLIASSPMTDVTVEMLPTEFRVYSSRRTLTTMEQLELDAILSAITRSRGNKVVAAKLLGISRSTLYRKMHSYRLDPDKHFY
jgi:transcriptional regulator of acetoin/glycerol metabolism